MKIVRVNLNSKGARKKNRDLQMPAHGFQKSEYIFFTDFFLPVYIFGHRQAKNGDGKKNMGCKKKSGVKKVIARPRFPTKICLQITIIFTCALTETDAEYFLQNAKTIIII